MKESNCCCDKEILAMASVPTQEWCEPYDWSVALEKGTIFPCLDLPFFKSEDNYTIPQNQSSTLNPDEYEQENMLLNICQISFALNDLTLYLDTHSNCSNGLTLLEQLCSERQTLLKQYAEKFNPLTQDSMTGLNSNENIFSWTEGPLPWEGGWISCGITKKDCNTL